ncbi:hypothetical protein F5I97DRAFT_1468711 [Phlebopus sp. FC_14]|nr:hypothetical protein F5I97DRAFT_1468711 [Phlebopus sp. FC_14]
MSAQAQNIATNGLWSQTQYSPQQPLQLEEQFPYSLDAQHSNQPPSASLQRHSAQLPSSIFSSFGSNHPSAASGFGSSPGQQYIGETQTTLTSSNSGQTTYPFTGVSGGHRPQAVSSNPRPTLATASSSSGYPFDGPLQFSYPQPLPRRQSELQAQYFEAQSNSSYMQNQSKRHRTHDDHDTFNHQSDPQDIAQEPANSVKPKPTGACSRCKSLKVRCEFRGNSDTCRRCTGAGQECVIPGRKPRRAPPKREYLLKQIRDQANQIEELMAKLEASNRRAAAVAKSSPDAQSPLSSSSGLHSPTIDTSEAVTPKPEVQDWIAKARESLQAFGGLIPTGTAERIGRDENDSVSSDDPYEEYSEDEDGYGTADDQGSGPKDKASPANSIKKKDTVANPQLNIPTEEYPFGLMAHLAIRQKSVEPESSDDAVGVASKNFFRPSPAPDAGRANVASNGTQVPHILIRDIVGLHEVEKLFHIYFDKMNPLISLLDPYLHTPQFVAMRSTFLFTVVCGIASRFYTARPELYGQLMQYAQLAAGSALITGTKNEEMCAAYLLMQLYPVPAKRWDEERSWIYLGVAIRIAQDINLNKPVGTKPLNEHHARVLLSRTRIWMNCFNLDRSTGVQYGKPPIIPNTDFVASHSENWWMTSPYNLKGFDIQTCIYNAELRLMADFMAKIHSDPTHPTALNKNANFAQVATDTADALKRLGDRWFQRLEEFDRQSETSALRTELLKMAFAYSRLVALSAGLKYAKEDQLDKHSFLMRCLDAATDVVNAFVRRLFPTPDKKIYLRHAPDAQFVFVTFAGAFLVKLLKPKFAPYFDCQRRVAIRTLVQEAVDLLGAPEVALDDKHGPKLFSRFLADLLASTDTSLATELRSSSKSSGRRVSGKGKGHAREQSQAPSVSELLSEVPSPSYPDSPSPVQNPAHIDGSSYGITRDPSFLNIGSNDDSMIRHSEFFQHPMLFDADLLESMQFMAHPSWQDTTVPGFSWMNQLDTSGSPSLTTNDYSMYDSNHYGS